MSWKAEKNIAYGCAIIGLVTFVFYILKICEGFSMSMHDKFNEDILDRTSKIGDFIGGVVGALWTLAGVFLYVSALKLQQEEMRRQRIEIDENQTLLNQQMFETTFFNLLGAQDNIRNNLKASFWSLDFSEWNIFQKEVKVGGVDFFNNASQELFSLYYLILSGEYCKWDQVKAHEALHDLHEDYVNDLNEDDDYKQKREKLYQNIRLNYIFGFYPIKEETFNKVKCAKTEKQKCAYIYWLFYHRYEYCIGHYCRHLYNIVKYLDDYSKDLLSFVDSKTNLSSMEKVREKEKIDHKIQTYFTFIQASLSSSELFFLFYDMFLCPDANELYLKYNLFKYLKVENLLHKSHAKEVNINIKSIEEFRDIIFGVPESAVI